MGQKVNPLGLRIGINQAWLSRWMASKANLALWIKEDNLIRKTLLTKLPNHLLAKIEIERQDNVIQIFLWTARLGVILGQKSKNINQVILNIKKALKRRDYVIKINVLEVKNPDLNAKLVANYIAYRLINREKYRILQKQAVKNAMRLGAKGIKITVSGRLNGADIARKEHSSEGKIPLSTLRANIDYGAVVAKTKYGQIGIKVWIYHGDISNKSESSKKNFK